MYRITINNFIYFKKMKKISKFIMMSVIALSGTTTFTSCSSDESAPVNPTFDGKSVKTSFTLSVSDVKGTRMSADAVQNEGADFQGMDDIYLFPAKATITNATVVTEGYINLPAFDAFDDDVMSAQGKIYNDVSFSVGVSDFLFYGANQTKDNGELKPSYLVQPKETFGGDTDWPATPLLTTSTIGSITFDLVPYQRGKDIEFIKTQGAATIAPLNALDAKLTEKIAAAETAGATAIQDELTELQTTIRNAKTKDGVTTYYEYAGSSKSIEYLFTKIYNYLMNREASLTIDETNYAEELIAIVTENFTTGGDETSGYTVKWPTDTDPKFPGSLNLPDGAVAIKYSTDDAAFSYTDYNVAGMIAASAGKYTHPARLYYTVNSKGMIRDAEYLNGLNNTQLTWEAVKTSGDYTPAAIKASTHSVILEDQVQFAVGRLDVAVRVLPGVVLKDSGSGIDNDAYKLPQPVVVSADGFPLTGVLIGGQKQVGWDFKPISSAEEQTIYDGDGHMADNIFAKQGEAYSAVNHTLALETKSDDAVNIALEFENNTGKDFYGINNNIIPAGSKFYLIAKLNPAQNVTENPNDLSQVFKQDYTTTANLTIGEYSLQNAYNVIPDLRSPKLEFGLSVDLIWQNGITFTQEFGPLN